MMLAFIIFERLHGGLAEARMLTSRMSRSRYADDAARRCAAAFSGAVRFIALLPRGAAIAQRRSPVGEAYPRRRRGGGITLPM